MKMTKKEIAKIIESEAAEYGFEIQMRLQRAQNSPPKSTAWGFPTKEHSKPNPKHGAPLERAVL